MGLAVPKMGSNRISCFLRKSGSAPLLPFFVVSLYLTSAAMAAEFDTAPGFGGPDAAEKTIAADRAPSISIITAEPLKAWNDWKKELTENTGISFTVDYSAVSLWASESFDDDSAASGMVRFYGAWDLIKRGEANSGAFIWKIEHRHSYGDPAPSGFALGELGYVGVQAPPFSDQEFRTTNLYWRQRFGAGRTTLIAGFLDSTDYVDVYALASPWLHFMNLAFSTGSASIALPNDAALGVAVGTMLNENWYVIGGLTDANSDPTNVFEGFDTFFDEAEFFKSVELGWTSSRDRLVLDNYHVTVWHKDEQDAIAVPDGWGVNFSFTRYVANRWLPFVRGGWAEDGGSLLEKSLSVGVGYQRDPGGNLLGFGLNWGEPNSDTFTSGLDNQYSAELFYRINIGQAFVVTGDIQYLKDPALNPEESSIWMANLRGRIAF
jgi:porin